MEINATLIGQLITFAILVWFTMRYVWPPIVKAMNEREKKIAAGLESAERGKRELEMAERKALNIIREAKEEASRIIEQSHKRADGLVEEAKEKSRQEAERIIERAREEIAREVIQAKEELRKQLATLAIAGAEKVIQQQLDAKSHAALLNQFAAEI